MLLDCFESEDVLLKTVMKRYNHLDKILKNLDKPDELRKLLEERKKFYTIQDIEDSYRMRWTHIGAIQRRLVLIKSVNEDTLKVALKTCIEEGKFEAIVVLIEYCTLDELIFARDHSMLLGADNAISIVINSEIKKRKADLLQEQDMETLLEKLKKEEPSEEVLNRIFSDALMKKSVPLIISLLENHYPKLKTDRLSCYLCSDNYSKQDVLDILNCLETPLRNQIYLTVFYYYLSSPKLDEVIEKLEIPITSTLFIKICQYQPLEIVKKYWRSEFKTCFVELDAINNLDVVEFLIEKMDHIYVPDNVLTRSLKIARKALVSTKGSRATLASRIFKSDRDMFRKCLDLIQPEDLRDLLDSDPDIFQMLAFDNRDLVSELLISIYSKVEKESKIRDL